MRALILKFRNAFYVYIKDTVIILNKSFSKIHEDFSLNNFLLIYADLFTDAHNFISLHCLKEENQIHESKFFLKNYLW